MISPDRSEEPMSAASLRAFVVMNPASAAGSTRRQWDLIARALGHSIGSFEHGFTDAPGRAMALAREALAAGFELIVAVGGDGTANEVACGFFDGARPSAPNAILGLVPRGTGCDLSRTLYRGSTLEETCARLAGREARAIDVGHVSFVGHDGLGAERVFLNVLSFGIGGAVVHALQAGAKRTGGKLAFMMTTARVLYAFRDQRVTVAVDGGPPEHLVITNVAVGNARYFGGGMKVAPAAEVDDGVFDVTIWSGIRFRDFIFKQRSLYDGTHADAPYTRVLRARRVEATSSTTVLLDVDGEAAGRLPIRVEILPRALRVKA
jgi:YegS/Rv2252/BmrU family lipid kinase